MQGARQGSFTRKRVGMAAVLSAAAVGVLASLDESVGAPASPSPVPVTAGELEHAQQTTVVLANAVLAAVVSVSDATPPDASIEQIESGFDAVSLLAPGRRHAFELLDASGSPIDHKNVPKGSFEIDGMADLLGGASEVQEVVGKNLRTLLPLTSDMHPNCMTCHSNYAALPPGTVIGAASFKVKL